jgi:hypothetical protein
MSQYDNYPDDIRRYDNDPRSPFYDDSVDEMTLSERQTIEEDAAERKAESRAEFEAWDHGYE